MRPKTDQEREEEGGRKRERQGERLRMNGAFTAGDLGYIFLAQLPEYWAAKTLLTRSSTGEPLRYAEE